MVKPITLLSICFRLASLAYTVFPTFFIAVHSLVLNSVTKTQMIHRNFLQGHSKEYVTGE